MKLNWNFLGEEGGGGVVQNKKDLPWGEYGYFLKLYNLVVLLSYQRSFNIFFQSSDINSLLRGLFETAFHKLIIKLLSFYGT